MAQTALAALARKGPTDAQVRGCACRAPAAVKPSKGMNGRQVARAAWPPSVTHVSDGSARWRDPPDLAATCLGDPPHCYKRALGPCRSCNVWDVATILTILHFHCPALAMLAATRNNSASSGCCTKKLRAGRLSGRRDTACRPWISGGSAGQADVISRLQGLARRYRICRTCQPAVNPAGPYGRLAVLRAYCPPELPSSPAGDHPRGHFRSRAACNRPGALRAVVGIRRHTSQAGQRWGQR